MFVKVQAEQAAKRQRNEEPRFAKTPEWAEMKPLLDAAAKNPKKRLKPDEVLQIQLTDAEKAKYRIVSRKTIYRFVKQYVESLALPYTVKSFRRDEFDYVLIRADE